MHAKRDASQKRKLRSMASDHSKRDISTPRRLPRVNTASTPKTPGFTNFEEVEDLVTKRKGEVSYLRRCILHDITEGGKQDSRRHFLNMSPAEGTHRNHIDQIVNDEQARCFFLLGLSLGKLIEIKDPRYCVNALAQLLEEFSYFTSSAASRTFRGTLQISEFEITSEEPMKVGIFNQGGQVVFQFFDTPRVPQFVDRRQILHGICSIVFLLYNRFLEVPEERFRKHLVKLDAQISKLVISPIVDTLTTLSKIETDLAFDSLLGTLERVMKMQKVAK